MEIGNVFWELRTRLKFATLSRSMFVLTNCLLKNCLPADISSPSPGQAILKRIRFRI